MLFSEIVGDIPITDGIDSEGISVIVDTSTMNYTENSLFRNSNIDDIYVIDHHGRNNGSVCIEDELKLPNENVIRQSSSSSVCEILANELDEKKITPKIANMLTLGLLTDTAKLKFIKEDTFKNLSKLLKLGSDYEHLIEYCTRKSNLRDEVGLANMLLNTKIFPIGDTFGMMLSMDSKEVKNLNQVYRIRSPQKKIFKMSDIKNCSFSCIISENIKNKYDVEFRSTSIYGNFDVLNLATKYKGGGHYNASGCNIQLEDNYSKNDLEVTLQKEVKELYTNQAIDLELINLNEQDLKLSEILNSTKRLTKNITPDILEKVDNLVKDGANYEYLFKTFKSLEEFMLQNEILSGISENIYNKRNPVVNIDLSQRKIDMLMEKYSVCEEDILDVINIFSHINVYSATISLESGKSVYIDCNGNIEKSKTSNKIQPIYTR